MANRETEARACAGLAALAALGWGAAEAGPVEFDASGRLTLLAGGFAQDADFAEEPAVGRASAQISAEKDFANGLGLEVVFGAAAERDHPRRDPRGGRAGDCPPGNPLCPSVAGRSVRGYLSGFTPGGPIDNQDGRIALEQAYLLVRGGYGEISVGRDEGVASRFSQAPPNVLPAGDLLQPGVDLTGFSGLIVRNDVSGQSFKLTAVSPRILGVRLGASWTPSIEAQGVDQGFARGPQAPLVADPRNVFEAGLSFERTWANGWETRFSGSYASGGDSTGLAAFDRLEGWSIGAGASRGPWSFVVQRLGSDNGWAGGGRGYRATSLSFVREGRRFSPMLAGGRARDDLALLSTSTATAALRWRPLQTTEIFAGLTAASRRVPVAAEAALGRRREETVGGFLGFSIGL